MHNQAKSNLKADYGRNAVTADMMMRESYAEGQRYTGGSIGVVVADLDHCPSIASAVKGRVERTLEAKHIDPMHIGQIY